jgi:allantoate deiminase
MSPELAGGLAGAIEALGFAVERLPSGAGHDAAPMSTITPAAMLFVRCRGGISHHPDESVEEDDVAVAIDVVERLVRGL